MRNVYDLTKPEDRRAVGAALHVVVQGFQGGEPFGPGLEALDAIVLHLQQQAAHLAMARSRTTWWERLRGRFDVPEPSHADLARMEGYLAGLYDLRAAIVDAARAAATPQPEESAPQRGYRPAAMGMSGVRA